jgi:multicomponent Na+:H+ antiporter subunit E
MRIIYGADAVEKTSGSTPDGLSTGHPGQDGVGLRQDLLMISAKLVILALLWLVLSGGNKESWVIGGPVVLLATACSHMISGRVRHPLRPAALVRFLPFFLWRSFWASIDVARRALYPRALLLDPALVDFPLHLPVGAPRLFMANVVSLLPGTLSAELAGDRLRVHVLDTRTDFFEELQGLEARVARIFDLQDRQSSGPKGRTGD